MNPEIVVAEGVDVSSKTNGLGFVLEIPIWPDEAMRRALPGHVAKLLVFPRSGAFLNQEDARTALAEWVFACKSSTEHVLAWPVFPFQSLKSIEAAFQPTRKLLVDTRGGDLVITCDSLEDIYTLMWKIQSEVTVFVFESSSSLLVETIKYVDRFEGDYRSIDVPLASRISAHGGFVFSNEGHESLELIGTEEFVLERSRTLITRPRASGTPLMVEP